jgi:hypothetical protein
LAAVPRLPPQKALHTEHAFEIDRTQSYTCDQSHDYTTEQESRNGGLMNQFVRFDAEPPENPRQHCT